MIKGCKIRIYPTKTQEAMIWKHIGSCRFVWNYMLELQANRYKCGEKHMSGYDMINLLPSLKNDTKYEWLKEVSSISLCRVCTDLAESYNNFFTKRSGFPRFKSRKRSRHSFPVRCTAGTFYFSEGFVHVEKIGYIKYKTDLSIPYGKDCKFYDARISYTNGKYMVSFGMECENQALELTDKSMGIDLGVKELAVVAYGEDELVFQNINKSKKVRDIKQRIKHIQRSISRKYEASKIRTGRYEKTKNIVREEAKLRKLHARLAGIRHNYLHHVTHELVSLLPKVVVMEDLNVVGMMKNKHLSSAVYEQCFYEFIRQMRYKCTWSGIEFIQVPRFYPSSKTCSCCGSVKRDLKLSDRTYVCNDCGFTIDRDYNAAINLMRYVDLQTQATA